jgi:hypothetical protein
MHPHQSFLRASNAFGLFLGEGQDMQAISSSPAAGGQKRA